MARGNLNNKRFNLGSFATQEEAALAYDAFSREHGLRRPFNVPKSKAEKAMTAAHAAPSNYHGVTWFKAGGKW